MTAYSMDCPPIDQCGSCGTLPAGFTRLRYFFGKRMGVADFLDEQRYHAGKMRFHNQRLHGAGMLCGLGVTRDKTTDVILRVGKGAAIDSCGREIIVGYDQCIDLDAWYQRELEDRRATDSTWPKSAVDDKGNLPIVVVIRFRDCAMGPEPAPRDTCSCDAAGCDFGRVREEFELAILPANDPSYNATLPLTPPRKDLDKLLGGSIGAGHVARALADAAAKECPDAGEDWLLLASMTAKLELDPAGVQRVTGVNNLHNRARMLAETALLQDLLARQMAASAQAGGVVLGPEVIALHLVREGSTDVYWLELELSWPVIKETVPKKAFTLTQLSTSGTPGWNALSVETHYAAPTATQNARIRVKVDRGGLADHGLYRLAIDPAKVPLATPIIDDKLRPLRPLEPTFHFGIEKHGSDLRLVPAPYAR